MALESEAHATEVLTSGPFVGVFGTAEVFREMDLGLCAHSGVRVETQHVQLLIFNPCQLTEEGDWTAAA